MDIVVIVMVIVRAIVILIVLARVTGFGNNMKSIIELVDNRVIGVKIVSDYITDKFITVHPYRNYFGLGNAYARTMRQKYHRIDRGYNADVMLVDEVNPEDYLFKLYDKNKDVFYNDNETDEERLHKIRYYYCVFPVHFFYDIEMLGVAPTRKDLDIVFGREYANFIEYKFRKHEPFSDDDFIKINVALSKAEEPHRTKIIFGFGTIYKIISMNEGCGGHDSHLLPSANQNESYRNKSIEWFGMLLGGIKEKEAMSEIASIYARSNMEDMAVSVYNEMLEKYDDVRSEVKKKIHYLGFGREIVNKIKSSYAKNDTQECMRYISDFKNKASGRVLYRCTRTVDLIDAACRGENKQTEKRISIFDCIDFWRDDETSS